MFRWIGGTFTGEEYQVDRGNLYWGRIASSFFVSCVQVDRGNLYWGRIAGEE